MTVDLSDVADVQELTLTLSNITGNTGEELAEQTNLTRARSGIAWSRFGENARHPTLQSRFTQVR